MTFPLGPPTRSCHFLQQPQLSCTTLRTKWGTSLTSRATTKPVKESQTQLRQLKSSLNSPFLHARASCLVVQWNLIQDVLRLPHWFGMTPRGLLYFDAVLLPLSLPIFTLLLYLKSARNIRKRKNSNGTSSPQSWEVRNKRVVKINENKFSKKYFKVFFITESSAGCSVQHTFNHFYFFTYQW